MNFIGKRLDYYTPPIGAELDKELTDENYRIEIPTLEGLMTTSRFDYIIKGIKGEFYPCKPDIFEKSYQEVKMNPKQLKEQRLKEILMELEEDYEYLNLENFEIIGTESEEVLNQIATSFHIDEIHREEGFEEENDFKKDKYDF